MTPLALKDLLLTGTLAYPHTDCLARACACHRGTYLVGLDVLNQRRLAAVVETNHENAHVPTKTAHS